MFKVKVTRCFKLKSKITTGIMTIQIRELFYLLHSAAMWVINFNLNTNSNDTVCNCWGICWIECDESHAPKWRMFKPPPRIRHQQLYWKPIQALHWSHLVSQQGMLNTTLNCVCLLRGIFLSANDNTLLHV